MKSITLILRSLAPAVALAVALGTGTAQLAPRAAADDSQYREFTGANGKKIKAELIDKTDDTLTLRLPNGKTATLSFDKVSPEDQEFVKKWNKEKQLRKEKKYDMYVGQKIQL